MKSASDKHQFHVAFFQVEFRYKCNNAAAMKG